MSERDFLHLAAGDRVTVRFRPGVWTVAEVAGGKSHTVHLRLDGVPDVDSAPDTECYRATQRNAYLLARATI